MRLTEVGRVICPECAQEIPIGAILKMTNERHMDEDGRMSQGVTLEPDLTDVWAHAWACYGAKDDDA